ncbi:MAG: aldehyde dehydrogenase [Planctomycetes bacterium]|nr:aldehyde dehydrogenase [Planctomycetota bacterium]
MPSCAPMQRAAAAWLAADPAARRRVLAELRQSLDHVADELVAAGAAAKGWSDLPHATAEEWASGPLPVARFLVALAASCRGRAPRVPFDRLFLRGHSAAVATLPDAPHHRHHGGLALVLGAGNVTATPLLDTLEQVFLHQRAVLLKPSPLHTPLLPHFVAALRPLVERDLVRLVPGGAEVAQRLAHDPLVDAVHLTGSATTWLALARDATLQSKHLTAEVGCCTPALVLPAVFADDELLAIARQLAAYVAINGGATCLAPRVLLTARGWPQHERLLDLLTAELAALPARQPFHPSVREHFALATGTSAPAGPLPPTLVRDRGDQATTFDGSRELFAPVLREVLLPADATDFASAAPAFVRERCFGALSAYVFAPTTIARRDRGLQELVRALPHGTVAINTWTGLGYGLTTVPWGVPADAALAHGRGSVRTFGRGDLQRVVLAAPAVVAAASPRRRDATRLDPLLPPPRRDPLRRRALPWPPPLTAPPRCPRRSRCSA